MLKLFVWMLWGMASLLAATTEELKKQLKQAIEPFDSSIHIGVEVVSLKGKETLFSHNSDHLFVPASVSKLLTAACALHLLGPDFNFETKLYIDEPGNLYLQGSGDPSFRKKDLKPLVSLLKESGVFKIRGNIVVDSTIFDTQDQGPGWAWDDPAEYWNTPINGVNIDHNCIQVSVSPGKIDQEEALVFVQTDSAGLSLKKSALTKGDKIDLKVQRLKAPEEKTIEVTGCISKNSEPQEFKIAVPDPSIYAGKILRELLQKRGVSCEGQVLKGKTPSDAKLVGVHRSEPLSAMICFMVKNSDNLYADCLFKKIGIKEGQQGTWQASSVWMGEFLNAHFSKDFSRAVCVDGSGMSRYNLMSPHMVTRILVWGKEDFVHSKHFLSSLSIAGVDGTLKNRMMDLKHKVIAKTGSMQGVMGLAGFVTTKDGEMIAFSIFANGVDKNIREFRKDLEDPICKILANFSRD